MFLLQVAARTGSVTTTQNMTGLYIFLLIALGFAAVIAYAYLGNRRAQGKQKKMIRAFRQNPVIRKNAPVLIHGPAQAPDLILPTTGEHVAYYALIVMSRETSLSQVESHARVGGSTLSTGYVTGLEGFRFFETGGDFTVNSGGVPYTVRISGVLDLFAQGFSKASSFVGGIVTSSGVPAATYNDTVGLRTAEGALSWAFHFSAPIKTRQSTTGGFGGRTTYASSYVKSVQGTVDTRVQEYTEGVNLPPGVRDLLLARGIMPVENRGIIVVELFIPLNREVWVFGTYDGDRSIIFSDPAARLLVSYDDPERI